MKTRCCSIVLRSWLVALLGGMAVASGAILGAAQSAVPVSVSTYAGTGVEGSQDGFRTDATIRSAGLLPGGSGRSVGALVPCALVVATQLSRLPQRQDDLARRPQCAGHGATEIRGTGCAVDQGGGGREHARRKTSKGVRVPRRWRWVTDRQVQSSNFKAQEKLGNSKPQKALRQGARQPKIPLLPRAVPWIKQASTQVACGGTAD